MTERARIDASRIADLHRRLAAVSAPGGGDDDWERGVPSGWLAGLLADWARRDPTALQGTLDGLCQRVVVAGGRAIHVVTADGVGPAPLPLVLTHGWPGSLLEYLDVLAPLSDPGAHGGDPADAFTVIVPSLPGFGFSAAPDADGLTSRAVAGLWREMMATLGHDRYVAHGSDLGAGVTGWLARLAPDEVAAVHLATPGLAAAPTPRSAGERRFADEAADWIAREGGYAHEQSTKPATLAIALADSPAGLAAWIAEKVVAWSPVGSDGTPRFGRERLLDTLTLYWATDTIASSLLPYLAAARTPADALPADDPAVVPTAVSIFGGERIPFPKPPRELAERYYAIAHWAEHPVGGHFPAVAEPELLVRTLRDVFRPYR